MSSSPEQTVIIFRSPDLGAREEAETIRDLLEGAGIAAAVLADDAPGVPSGVVAVRVAAAQEKQAEAVLAAAKTAQPLPADNTSKLDLVGIFEGVGATGELEAISIRAVLDANGLPSVLVGSSTIPNLPFVVQVPAVLAAQAREALAEAQRAGEAAAEAAGQGGEA